MTIDKNPPAAWIASTAGMWLLTALIPCNAVAQQEAAQSLAEIVVVGTRRQVRTAVDTAVPVDVFKRQDVESVSSDDMLDIIRTLVPSFQVQRFAINDGAAFVRPRPQSRDAGLDPETSGVQSVLASIRMIQFGWIGSEQDHSRAIESLTDRPTVERYALLLVRAGRILDAQEQTDRARKLEPPGGHPPAFAWHANLAQGRISTRPSESCSSCAMFIGMRTPNGHESRTKLPWRRCISATRSLRWR